MALTEKQLEERRHYIGGSDVGAILGYSKWKTPLDVYFEKVEGKKSEVNNNFIYWGNQLEPLIRNIFTEITSYPCEEIKDTKYHSLYPFIAANIDGLITISEKEKAILEIKTVSQFARSQWGKPQCDLDLPPENIFLPTNGFKNDDGYVPMSYLCQVILYASVYEIDKVYIAVYFGNDIPLQIYQYNRDLQTENIVLDKLCYFWKECVEKEIPPSPQSKEELKLFYPEAKENTFVTATNEVEDYYHKIKQLKLQQSSLGDQIDILSNKIMAHMESDEILITNSGDKLATWINVTTKRLDTTKLKTEDESLYKKYLKESKCRRFKIY
jgi:putative phage-type endonuclease